MQFDIINISEEELNALTVVQMKLLRTAQQRKDELCHKAEKDMKTYRAIFYTDGMHNSSLISAKQEELQEELNYQIAILADNLIYNMSINEPTIDGDIGDEETDEGAGYIVDYTLSYTERYMLVRDYYLSISDPAERMALYSADETAKRYLSGYYTTLYNVLYTYSK